MVEWLSSIFDTSGYPARWLCGPGWSASPGWGWLHIVSDLATFGAYLAIPIVFIYFLRKRPDLPLPRIWWLFAIFIFACGTVHLIEALLFWWPVYRLSGVIKFITAIASWATVLALLPVIPIALTFKGPQDLENEVRERTAQLHEATLRMRDSDERLRLALQAGRMGTWNWNLQTNQVEFDATEIEITGLGQRDPVIDVEQFFQRVHRDDRDALEKAIQRAVDTSEPYIHVFRLYVADRGYRWLQGRGSVIRDAKGQAERMVGVNFDITDQMADQEALRVRTRAIEFATNGILITDARAEDHPIIYVNPAFEQLTGYERQEVLGRNCRFLQGASTDPQAVDKLRNAIRRQQECQVTILNYHRNGAPFWNNLHIAPVENDEGRVTHFVGVQTDVTERVENERRLIVAQAAAESANRAKSEFLANMSHEIRTPLTAILGCADSLCRELDAQQPRETARTIRSQGQLLMGILNDVLDLSKIEAGKLEIHTEPCSILSLISDVRSLMDPQAQGKGLELTTTIEGLLPETVITDPLRFRQILLNLTGNAIKFTDSGRVDIIARCEPVDSAAQVVVIVRDTGIGIAPERLATIFDPFTQADETVARRVGGTGLGLTICQRLIHMLGGQITVDSQIGSGSTFAVTLPVDVEAARHLFTVEELTQRKSQKESNESLDVLLPVRVLIAEDTKAIQFMLQRMLEPVVDEVVVVDNGEKTLELLDQTQNTPAAFDIVLMDMQMPVMNGYDATAQLRHRGHRIPVIALTAGAMAGDRERCLAVGCTDYLSKPVSRGQLLGMMVAYCNQTHSKPT